MVCLKTNTQQLMKISDNNSADAPHIVAKQLSGRNVTIVKAESEPKTTKTPTVPKTKVTVEENKISGYEKDCKEILIFQKKFDLDDDKQNCSQCQFETHSLGLFRKTL